MVMVPGHVFCNPVVQAAWVFKPTKPRVSDVFLRIKLAKNTTVFIPHTDDLGLDSIIQS